MENQIISCLDKPDNNEAGYFRFYICGWVLPPGKIQRFEVCLNDKKVTNFKTRQMKRPDLVAAFPKIMNAGEGGFEGIVEVGEADGNYSLTVYGVMEDNERVLIGQKNIVNEKSQINLPPRYLSLGLISRCNFSCKMCPVHSSQSGFDFKGGVMEKKISDKILSELPAFSPLLQGISPHDYGEPFLSNDLFDILANIREKLPHVNINLSTNGSLLNDNLIGKILNSGISSISFSLDAATDQTYQKMRPGGNFQSVIGNIKKIIAQRKKMNLQTPVITTNFVITRVNLNEIIQYITLCKMLEVDGIGFVHPFGLFNSDKDSLILPLGEKGNEYCDHFLTIKKEIEVTRSDLKNKCIIPNIFPNDLITDCSFNGKTRMFIDTNGDVFPCCVIAAKGKEKKSDVKRMGNVYNQSLQEIWDSSEFTEFRKKFYKGIFPHSICKICPKYYGI